MSAYDLQVDPENSLLAVRFDIRESEPVLVSAIDVDVREEGQTQNPRLAGQPADQTRRCLQRGRIPKSRTSFADFSIGRGYAHVKTERKAEVDLDQRQVQIRYSIQPGPLAQFGDTEIKARTRSTRN